MHYSQVRIDSDVLPRLRARAKRERRSLASMSNFLLKMVLEAPEASPQPVGNPNDKPEPAR